MAQHTIIENIHRNTEDWFAVKEAVRGKGVDCPDDTPTAQVAEKIEEIETGITPTGTINIIENGTDIDVSEYAYADVDVSGLTVDSATYDNTVTKCEPVSDSLYDLEIPTDTTYTFIGNQCCFANSNVRSVTIGNNITSILQGLSQNQYGEGNAVFYSAFGYCKNLSNIYGGSNISSVGDLSFAGCTYLTGANSLLSSGNLSYVGDYGFYGCRSLQGTLKINRLNTIGAYGFDKTRLSQIYILGTANVSYPNTVKIDENAFRLTEAGSHYEKIIINTNGGSNLNIEPFAFSGDTDTTVSVLAILSNDITFANNSFADFHSSITDFYTHLNQSDFTTWLNNLSDTTLKNAITNATNIHYEYTGDGSEL